MSNHHTQLHIIVSALACVITVLITTLLGGKFETASSRQGGKIVGLYAGMAALEFLGCVFACRAMAETAKVDLYVKARLIEWRQDVEAGVFKGYAHGGDVTLANQLLEEGEDDEAEDDGVSASAFKDPQLAIINQKIEQLERSNRLLKDGAQGLKTLLDDSKKREADHVRDNLVLVRKAQIAEEHCTYCMQKLSFFEGHNSRQVHPGRALHNGVLALPFAQLVHVAPHPRCH